MKSVFKTVLNKLRSTFRRSTDQNLNQCQHSQQKHKDSFQEEDDSEQSGKIKNSRSDSSLGTCSIVLGNNSNLNSLIENELKNKTCLPRNKHQTVIRCLSATCSPRRPPPLPHHPPVKQYGSNKSTRSFGSTLSGKSVKSVSQLNEQTQQQTTSSSKTSSTTNLAQQQKQQFQRKDISCQNSNDTLSTTSSIALLFNQVTTKNSLPISQKQLDQQFIKQKSGSNTSLLKNDSFGDSSSHLSSIADTVPELPNLNEDDRKTGERSSYNLKELSEMDSSISASSPNLFNTVNLNQQQNQSTQQQQGQPLLISQSMSMDEPELSDTDSLIAIEIDQNKVRSKSVDASVVMAMKNQNLAVSSTGQKGKPRGSTPFLEIPKWRLFVRKQSTSSSTLNVNNNLSNLNTSGSSTNISQEQSQTQSTARSPSTPNIAKLTDIFKDCVHCKWLMIIEPQKQICNYNESISNDIFSDNNNNIPLTENQSLEEEDEEDFSDDLDSEEDCQPMISGQQAGLFQGNDFSSTAVYHQQAQPSSNVAKDSGVRRYIKNRQRRSSYNVTYYSKPQANIQPTSSRPSSATGFIKKPESDKKSDNTEQQAIFRLPSIALSEASDDEDKEKDNAMNDLIEATNQFSCETQFISIQITEPSASCCEGSELDDPGSGITVVSLEVPVLNSGKQARSASVDSSFLQVPQRTDVEGINDELPPAKSIRSKSVDMYVLIVFSSKASF